MAKIIAIQDDYVLLEERGDHYQITISFLDFVPRVGDNVMLLKNERGEILKATLVENQNIGFGPKKSVIGIIKTIAIYSIVFGALATIGMLDGENELQNPMSFLLAIALLGLGVAMLLLKETKHIFGLTVTIFILYCLFVVLGLVVMFVLPVMGFLILLMVGVPFAFCIAYFVRRSKNQQANHQIYK